MRKPQTNKIKTPKLSRKKVKHLRKPPKSCLKQTEINIRFKLLTVHNTYKTDIC